MTQQISFSEIEYDAKKKQTRRDVFLAKMETVVPFARLVALIAPHYPTSGRRGRPPLGIERMLRMYFVQQWYALADEAVEDALYDSHGWSIPFTSSRISSITGRRLPGIGEEPCAGRHALCFGESVSGTGEVAPVRRAIGQKWSQQGAIEAPRQ